MQQDLGNADQLAKQHKHNVTVHVKHNHERGRPGAYTGVRNVTFTSDEVFIPGSINVSSSTTTSTSTTTTTTTTDYSDVIGACRAADQGLAARQQLTSARARRRRL